MRIMGLKKYFGDPWNCFETLEFGTFVAYFCMRIQDPSNTLIFNFPGDEFKKNEIHSTDKKKVLVILNVIIVVFIMLKII